MGREIIGAFVVKVIRLFMLAVVTTAETEVPFISASRWTENQSESVSQFLDNLPITLLNAYEDQRDFFRSSKRPHMVT